MKGCNTKDAIVSSMMARVTHKIAIATVTKASKKPMETALGSWKFTWYERHEWSHVWRIRFIIPPILSFLAASVEQCCVWNTLNGLAAEYRRARHFHTVSLANDVNIPRHSCLLSVVQWKMFIIFIRFFCFWIILCFTSFKVCFTFEWHTAVFVAGMNIPCFLYAFSVMPMHVMRLIFYAYNIHLDTQKSSSIFLLFFVSQISLTFTSNPGFARMTDIFSIHLA